MGPGSLKSSMAKTATVDSFRGTPQWKLTGVQLDGAAGLVLAWPELAQNGGSPRLPTSMLEVEWTLFAHRSDQLAAELFQTAIVSSYRHVRLIFQCGYLL